MLPRVELGKTGLKVTQLGYGSMGLRGPNTWGVRVVEERQAERVLHAVLDAGINFLDTAPDYGIAEQRIGKYLSSRRDAFYLATKCGCDPVQHRDHLEVRHTWKKEVLQRNLEASLQHLRTDYVDLMQFHGGQAAVLQDQGLIELAQAWKQEGKVRFLGISTKLPDALDHLELGVFDTFQIPYSCLAPEHDECLKKLVAAGRGVIIRGGIAHGGPNAEIQRPLLNEVWDQAQLDELLPAGMNRAEFILRATLAHEACHTTIVGTCNLEHLADNVRAASHGPLDDSTSAELTRRITKVLSA